MKPVCSKDFSSMRVLRSNSVTKEEEVECGSQPKHVTKGASFIKLLDCDFSKQLQIPHEFAMIFNGCVPHRFIIESAISKKCWRVEVEEDRDGTVYFREGWADFVEAHHLEVGNFLLFEYEEQSILLVKIYEKNGCHGCKNLVQGAQEGNHNPEKIIDFKEEEESQAIECEPKKLETSRSRQETSKKVSTGKYGNGIYKKHHKSPNDSIRTATVSFNGSNVVFSVRIHPYKNHQFRQLTIPKGILSRMELANINEVTVENYMGTRWQVKLSHICDGRIVLTTGWKEFMTDNDVAAGDSLSLEFISHDLVKVQVTKASEVEEEEENSQNGATLIPNMDRELDTCTVNVDPAEALVITKRGIKRGSPEPSSSSFSLLWGATTSGIYLHVPKVVSERQDLMNKDRVVLRDPEGNCWPVEVSIRYDDRVTLTKGWSEFWKSHSIKTGDSLDFKFVSRHIIQVKINRGKALNSPTKIEDINHLSTTNKRNLLPSLT